MNKKYIAIFVAALVIFSFSAETAFAVWTWGKPLVPCGFVGGARCKPCDLYALLKNLIDFVLIGLMPIAAGLLFTLAGFYYLTGGAVPANIQKAKSLFTSTIYAVAVISGAWLITNTLIVNLANGTAGGDSSAEWYTVQCTNPADQPVNLPPIVFIPAEQCKKGMAEFAKAVGATNPKQESSALQAAKNCLLADEEIARRADPGQLYTYDRSNDWCNYTQGAALCTPSCSHSEGCHYAGPAASGTGFVEAVDFNAKDGNELALCRAITRKAKECGIDFVNFEGDHTHVSTKACKKDVGGGSPCY